MIEHTPFFWRALDRLHREHPPRSMKEIEDSARRLRVDAVIKARRAKHQAMIRKDYIFEELMKASGQTVRVTLDYLRWTQPPA